jgi:hypothetical protein
MRKAKAKKAGGGSKKGDKAEAAAPAPAADDAPPSPATAEPTATESPEKEPEQQEEEKPTEEFPDAPEDTAADAKPASASTTPSLSQQSKARSTSFRQGSSGPLSPSLSGAAGLGLFSPEGETAPDIYRKHVLRIEELEKENKALGKEAKDAEKRWQKAEGELADLREGETAAAAGEGGGDVGKLVSLTSPKCTPVKARSTSH